MISSGQFLALLVGRGVTEVTGVPCSYLTPLINRVASGDAVPYVRATQEGEALAIASGCWLAGATTAVIAQNSGLGNMVNPLTSLNHPARIPVPLILTWRGEPGRPDEPQHQLLGQIMLSLLSLVETETVILPDEPDAVDQALASGWEAMERSALPCAFIMRQGFHPGEPISEPPPPVPAAAEIVNYGAVAGMLPTRMSALECLVGALPEEAAVISTTGKTSRELFVLADRPQQFYLVGAMGSASAVGLGVARHTRRTVVVIDGDGAALMRLGTFATIGAHAPANLVHVLLDNQVHDSTGGQRTLSTQVDWPAIAAACGYARVYCCDDLSGFADALKSAQASGGPAFIRLPISPGSLANLPRPDVHPADVARRFRDFVTRGTR